MKEKSSAGCEVLFCDLHCVPSFVVISCPMSRDLQGNGLNIYAKKPDIPF